MKIYVRRRHIEGGNRLSERFCPIALAIRDIVGGDITVLSGIVIVGRKTSPLPSIARKFILSFDSGKPVKPFAFVLK